MSYVLSVPAETIYTPSFRRPAAVDGLPLVESRTLVRTFVHPPGKVYMLYGSRAVFSLSLTMASYAIAQGGRMAVVDGGNQFNVHLLAQFARRRRLNPDEFLKQIFVSRGFTCYQMEQAVTNRLPQFLKQIGSSTAMVFGLLDTFYDDQVKLHEVRQILQRLLGSLQAMRTDGMSVLLVCEERTVWPEERNQLFTTLKQGVDRVYLLDAEGDRPRLFLEKGEESHGTHRTDLHEHHRSGTDRLAKIPPRTAQGGPGSVR